MDKEDLKRWYMKIKGLTNGKYLENKNIDY